MESPLKKEILNFPVPSVKFDLREDLNAQILAGSLGLKGEENGGAEIGDLIQKYNPELIGYEKLDPDARLTKVKEYLHGIYQSHKHGLENALQETNTVWKEYSPQFFKEVRKIFPNTQWPEGKYIGHLAVTPPLPRFLETKTFMVFFQPVEKAVNDTAHEMLHFMFFEYVRQRYLPDMQNTVQKEMETRLEGKFKVPLWELSEIFNLMVLSGKEWGMGSAELSNSSYTKLVAQVPEFQKIWEDSGRNIDDFFTKIKVS